MPSKYITAPIIIIAILGMISLVGELNSSGQNFGIYSQSTATLKTLSIPNQQYLYDASGIPVIYGSNFTAVNPNEQIVIVNLPTYTGPDWSNPAFQTQYGYTKYAGFTNGTGQVYALYLDSHATQRVLWTSVNNYKTAQSPGTSIGTNINFDIGAVIAVISLILVVAAVIGIQVVGSSAVNDTTTSVLLKIGAFLGLWGIFSGLAYAVLLIIPLSFGVYLWFFLTLIYVVGLIDTIGHPSQ